MFYLRENVFFFVAFSKMQFICILHWTNGFLFLELNSKFTLSQTKQTIYTFFKNNYWNFKIIYSQSSPSLIGDLDTRSTVLFTLPPEVGQIKKWTTVSTVIIIEVRPVQEVQYCFIATRGRSGMRYFINCH